jgi:uncharacterized protein with FMN-binding domain
MKKFLLSVFVLGVFTLYALRLKLGDNENPVVAIKTNTVSETPGATTFLQTPSSIPSSTLGPTPNKTATPTGKYKDGSYTGSVADAFYGNIQVQVVISGGKISDVIFLQYPNDRGTSIEINSQAMPMLKQEAIQAQSANVIGVTGATASSDAFIQSLQSALSQAV